MCSIYWYFIWSFAGLALGEIAPPVMTRVNTTACSRGGKQPVHFLYVWPSEASFDLASNYSCGDLLVTTALTIFTLQSPGSETRNTQTIYGGRLINISLPKCPCDDCEDDDDDFGTGDIVVISLIGAPLFCLITCTLISLILTGGLHLIRERRTGSLPEAAV